MIIILNEVALGIDFFVHSSDFYLYLYPIIQPLPMKVKKSIIHFVFLSVLFCSNRNGKIPVTVQGTMNLKGWDFNRSGILKLAGEWKFNRDGFLLPESFTGPFHKPVPRSIPLIPLKTNVGSVGVFEIASVITMDFSNEWLQQ
jgi:hypothetical protein